VPTDPGGTKYMRYVNNGLGYSPEVRRRVLAWARGWHQPRRTRTGRDGQRCQMECGCE